MTRRTVSTQHEKSEIRFKIWRDTNLERRWHLLAVVVGDHADSQACLRNLDHNLRSWASPDGARAEAWKLGDLLLNLDMVSSFGIEVKA